MQKEVKLWNRDFVFIIIINFLVFLNHLSILSTFPFYIEYLGGSEAVAGMAAALIFMLTYGALENFAAKFAVEQHLSSGGIFFAIMAVFNILSILIYLCIGRNHPSSFTYRKKLAAK